MITEQLSLFMCFASGLSIFAEMAQLFFADIKSSTLEANQEKCAVCTGAVMMKANEINRKHIVL